MRCFDESIFCCPLFLLARVLLLVVIGLVAVSKSALVRITNIALEDDLSSGRLHDDGYIRYMYGD